jgi:hypothetical protein
MSAPASGIGITRIGQISVNTKDVERAAARNRLPSPAVSTQSVHSGWVVAIHTLSRNGLAGDQ